jgi:hypothetical protein
MQQCIIGQSTIAMRIRAEAAAQRHFSSERQPQPPEARRRTSGGASPWNSQCGAAIRQADVNDFRVFSGGVVIHVTGRSSGAAFSG